MKSIKIIGVPEHFNLPWHMALEEGAFEERGLDLQWEDIPEGTGKMCQMLQNGEADLAIILTEGITKSIIDGNPVKIVQEYISSPLLWGIHVAAGSAHQSVANLKNATVAISRYGSGSHLMAYVHAQEQHWDTQQLQFEVVNTTDGAIAALTEGKADYFMWEHFTTKPLVDEGIFRRLGDCPTPWPCFVLAASDSFIQNHRGALNHILDVINGYTEEFKSIPSIDRTLANRYGQQLEDIQEWLALTEWGQQQLGKDSLELVQNRLYQLGLVKQKVAMEQLLA